jgi:hypothetical protein
MQFYSGPLMHLLSGVDTCGFVLALGPVAQIDNMSEPPKPEPALRRYSDFSMKSLSARSIRTDRHRLAELTEAVGPL